MGIIIIVSNLQSVDFTFNDCFVIEIKLFMNVIIFLISYEISVLILIPVYEKGARYIAASAVQLNIEYQTTEANGLIRFESIWHFGCCHSPCSQYLLACTSV